MSTDEIKIGILATLVGPYAALGEDGMCGVDLAVAEFGRQVCGKKIRLFKESTNAIPDSAYYMAQQLLDQDAVDFIVGPLSGNEGLAIRDYAVTRQDKTFINGNAGAQDITLRTPAPNFFSFSTNGVQWMAGLGRYVYDVLGYKRIAIVAEDYSYPHGQVGGFMIPYCQAGGHVKEKLWVALGNADYRAVIAALPEDIDALFIALGGVDAVSFIEQYRPVRHTVPLIGGSITVDQTVLGSGHSQLDHIVGMVSAGPIADSNPDPLWQTFVKTYQDSFRQRLPSPSLFAYGYYVNTKAALLALQSVNCDLSNDQQAFKAALNELQFDTPTGRVRLDHNRNAIANIFITMVDKNADGTLYNRLIKMIPAVDQMLGLPEEDYLAIGTFGRDNPSCS